MEQWELSSSFGGNAQRRSHFGRYWQLMTSWSQCYTCSSDCTLRYLHQCVEDLGPNKILHTDVYSRFMHNYQTLKAIKMPLSRWRHKLGCVGTLGCHAAIQRNELPSHRITCRNLKWTVLSVRRQFGKASRYCVLCYVTFWKRWSCNRDSKKISGFGSTQKGVQWVGEVQGSFKVMKLCWKIL